jgi:hypothetical protein
MHPSITASRRRRADSNSLLCLGVSPQIDPGDIGQESYPGAWGGDPVTIRAATG